LLVRTRAANKGCTTILIIQKSKITTVKDLIKILDNKRQLSQIHLVLQTLDTTKPLYNTPSLAKSSNKALTPISKLMKKKAKATKIGSNKRIKIEDKVKVCCTISIF